MAASQSRVACPNTPSGSGSTPARGRALTVGAEGVRGQGDECLHQSSSTPAAAERIHEPVTVVGDRWAPALAAQRPYAVGRERGTWRRPRRVIRCPLMRPM